jgi:L-seryl-tRNA(Ser) seleniumtransferase
VDSTPNPYRDLPAVDQVLAGIAATGLPRPLLVATARSALDLARRRIAGGAPVDVEQTALDLARGLLRTATHRVVNATGVLLHTNLGRAPLSARAAEAVRLAASSYTNLELDLATGERGRRGGYVIQLLRALTGAEDAMVVNNNAAAVLLVLAATSSGRAVPVSRGELIEIGGSYRLPQVTTTGGARLVEVGTTNRTRLGDYETALQIHDCGALLKVHPSNYRVEGFVETVSVEDLAGLVHDRGVPLIFDVGSGLIDAGAPWLGRTLPAWLAGEPGVRQALDAGADLVTFSGDKLVGGPQAGIVVGSGELIERLREHPLARALRVDSMTDAALAATLEALAGDDPTEIPLWRMATLSATDLRSRVDGLAVRLGGSVVDGESVIGAGSFPGVGIPSPQITLEGEDHLYVRLLGTERPILTRRLDKDLVIDLRAVAPEDDDVIAEMVARCR